VVSVDIASTSKPVEHMKQRLINVDETMEKASEVEKQVDHTKVSTSLRMPLVNATYEMIGENITGDLIPIPEHVQSLSVNVNVESHCKRPTIKSLEHEVIITLIAHNDLETIENIDLDKLEKKLSNNLVWLQPHYTL